MSFLRSSLLLVALALGVSSPAKAIPLFFEGNLGVGFDAADPDVVALGIDMVMDGSYTFVSAGAPALNPELEVTTSLLAQPFVPASPSFADPILANVLYVVRNTTGAVLDDEHLVFTFGGNLNAYSELTPDEFGIDVPSVVLIQQASCTGNAVGPCVYGAVALPVMAPGAVVQFQIQHLMADTLSGSLVIPTPGLAMLEHTVVPEPAAAGLLLLGLGALLRHRRS
ncbi:MAG: PEP-CTERM sorting domain-containing protein [Deltaproteobacteria bacterium]|nr:PEP-CTERM sorting domain-containing protein [Deltaproteobacteria bacterium]MBW2448218.1 PEP-CTERM sorting domain-containing protein [Deltaproteobacteria bacterium]